MARPLKDAASKGHGRMDAVVPDGFAGYAFPGFAHLLAGFRAAGGGLDPVKTTGIKCAD